MRQIAKDELVGASMIGSNDALHLFDFDYTDPVTPCDQEEDEPEPPLSNFYIPQLKPTNLRQLAAFIHGDIYHCAICSTKFEEPANLPRVLFCGDCLCERCIRSSIQPKAITDGKNREAAG